MSATNPATCTVVSDEYGNRAIFEDGCVPAEVNGVPVEIISAGLTWEEAHDLL